MLQIMSKIRDQVSDRVFICLHSIYKSFQINVQNKKKLYFSVLKKGLLPGTCYYTFYLLYFLPCLKHFCVKFLYILLKFVRQSFLNLIVFLFYCLKKNWF